MTLEERIKYLEKIVKQLEIIAHEPRTFVRCEECLEKVTEQESGNKN